MATKIIDLSMETATDPSPMMDVKITNRPHEHGAKIDRDMWGIDPNDWPIPGKGFATDYIEMGTHAGTHLDAPWHFGPLCEGKPSKTVDKWPLEWCYGDGVVVDISDLPDGYSLSVEELKERMNTIGYKLKPGDIFLARTGNDKYFGTEGYADRGGHLSPEALEWVLDHGIHTVGTDAWSFDIGYKYWSENYKKHGRDSKYLWPCHLVGHRKEYAHYEKLANLETLPLFGFKFFGFPIKFSRASAGYVRAVAFVEE